MVDKITARIKRYPFQTGIVIGFLICLILVGFISLFQDNGRTLSGNIDIIREDYLRMAINEYGQNRDEQLAGWRYQRIGGKADETLKLMIADSTLSPQLLAAYSNAIGKTDVLRNGTEAGSGNEGTPASPRKGLSGFAKTILIILGLIVLSAAGLYAASVIQTKRKQKLRSDNSQRLRDEPMNVVTPEKPRASATDVPPSTLFDLDSLFPQNDGNKADSGKQPIPQSSAAKEADESSSDLDKLFSSDSVEAVDLENGKDTEESKADEAEPLADDQISLNEDGQEENQEDITETESADDLDESDEPGGTEADSEDDIFDDDDPDEPVRIRKFSLDYDTSVETVNDDVEAAQDDPEPEPQYEADPVREAEKPLVETDPENDAEDEDELLKMIRSGNPNPDTTVSKSADELILEEETVPASAETEPSETADTVDAEEESTDNLLIHYQSTYRIGNDMYDEVFSIDQGDVFRGECGISIGETLNNTEPKAVTAFEVWLFDKDDIHTATWYLMSDFALENEGIRERLQQHGQCERIRKNGTYTLETETLTVDIRVMELEYGTEMEEKNSYFTNVSFDVVARAKDAGTAEG